MTDPHGASSFEPVTFWCDGDRLQGRLYRGRDDPKGAVVLTGPLTSVKEQATGAYAAALAALGWTSLAFDHRTFGESEGGPRQYESPPRKADDIRAATAFLSQECELPIYAVGVCAGAGYMAAAVARQPEIRSFAGVAGFYTDVAITREWMGDGYDQQLDRARDARRAYEATGTAAMIPAVGEDGADVAMPLAEAFEFYGTARGAVPNYVNGFAVQSRLDTLPFDAQSAADHIDVPTLMVHSEAALSPDLARAFFARLPGSKTELWLTSQGQIDFYDDPALIRSATVAIDRHFTAS